MDPRRFHDPVGRIANLPWRASATALVQSAFSAACRANGIPSLTLEEKALDADLVIIGTVRPLDQGDGLAASASWRVVVRIETVLKGEPAGQAVAVLWDMPMHELRTRRCVRHLLFLRRIRRPFETVDGHDTVYEITS